ncbi:MAG: NUDIX domain-containing protein, partial [Pseudomonadota bacterium]|nr:NUDIX domain-containing protein [Pseudomonadota bacterium]
MSVFPSPMTAADVVVEAKEVAYQGFFRMEKLTLRHKRFNGEWMGPFTRELFERGQAVCVLLFDPRKDAVVLLEQFRVGALEDERSPWLIELVAGMVDEGETPEDVALRESEEEAGTVPT